MAAVINKGVITPKSRGVGSSCTRRKLGRKALISGPKKKEKKRKKTDGSVTKILKFWRALQLRFSQARKESDQGKVRVQQRGCPAALRGPQRAEGVPGSAGTPRAQPGLSLLPARGPQLPRHPPGKAPGTGPAAGGAAQVGMLKRREEAPTAGRGFPLRARTHVKKKTLESAEEDGDLSWEREGRALGKGERVISHRSATSSRYQRR